MCVCVCVRFLPFPKWLPSLQTSPHSPLWRDVRLLFLSLPLFPVLSFALFHIVHRHCLPITSPSSHYSHIFLSAIHSIFLSHTLSCSHLRYFFLFLFSLILLLLLGLVVVSPSLSPSLRQPVFTIQNRNQQISENCTNIFIYVMHTYRIAD